MKSNLLLKRPRHWRGATLFILLAVAFMFYLFRHPSPSSPAFVSADSIAELRTRYLKDGIGGYLQAKKALREQLRDLINHEAEDSEQSIRATRMATYLFPEILPDTNFEKPIAEDLWAPLEQKIEQNSRTTASRETFEELRATIWNYESPDRKSPEISEDAGQVLRIYDTLSAPQ